MRKQKGFSLVELLIVVSIILIIASMAIPNLLRARIAANEASAASSIRAINTAQVMYQSTYPAQGYANVLSKLGPGGDSCPVPTEATACLIDNSLANASVPTKAKSGYYFGIFVPDGEAGRAVLQYTVSGSAASFNQTGVRDFCSSEDGMLHFRVPTEQSSPETGANSACGTWLPLQ
jgi:prepilin-type N-terminal cleavage/methylation domain-containing protein